MLILLSLCLTIIMLYCFFQTLGNYNFDLTCILGLGVGCCSSIILFIKAFNDYCSKHIFNDKNSYYDNYIDDSYYETINSIKYKYKQRHKYQQRHNYSKYAKEAIKKYNNPIKITVYEENNKNSK
jgi:hypothetical protein